MATSFPDEKEILVSFFTSAAKIRNQIYQDSIGPEIPRTWNMPNEQNIWPRPQIHYSAVGPEPPDRLENILSVEWTVQTYKLGEEEVRLFTSMKCLQRCKFVVETSNIHFSTWALRELRDQDWHSKVPRMHCSSLYHINVSPCWALKVEDTVLGLVYQLNCMPQLKELHLEYKEDDNLRWKSFFVDSADGSLRRYSGYDIKMLFNSDLRYMKKVQNRGNLDDYWTASIASAVIIPKETFRE